MLGRVMATGVVVFWITMMGALVRLEYWPAAGPISQVPTELVLRKVFSRDFASLRIYYQDQEIGVCRLDFTPLEPAAAPELAPAPAPRGRYLVHTNLKLAVSLLSLPSRLSVEGDTTFNARYEIESFQLHSTLAEGQIDLRGDAISRQVQLDFRFGDRHEQRVFDFQQVQGAGLASVLGLPGLGALGGLGGAGGPTAADGSQARTTITVDSLTLAGSRQEAYLIETRVDDGLWARLWVSQQGDILMVETSLGVTMLADVYSPDTLQKWEAARGTSR